jgi:hypothetical protein
LNDRQDELMEMLRRKKHKEGGGSDIEGKTPE